MPLPLLLLLCLPNEQQPDKRGEGKRKRSATIRLELPTKSENLESKQTGPSKGRAIGHVKLLSGGSQIMLKKRNIVQAWRGGNNFFMFGRFETAWIWDKIASNAKFTTHEGRFSTNDTVDPKYSNFQKFWVFASAGMHGGSEQKIMQKWPPKILSWHFNWKRWLNPNMAIL